MQEGNSPWLAKSKSAEERNGPSPRRSIRRMASIDMVTPRGILQKGADLLPGLASAATGAAARERGPTNFASRTSSESSERPSARQLVGLCGKARRDEPGREGTLQHDPLSKVGEGQ